MKTFWPVESVVAIRLDKGCFSKMSFYFSTEVDRVSTGNSFISGVLTNTSRQKPILLMLYYDMYSVLIRWMVTCRPDSCIQIRQMTVQNGVTYHNEPTPIANETKALHDLRHS